MFLGSHKFHNFTKKVNYKEGTARRFIRSFKIEEIIDINGVQFAKFIIQADSFLYHQIRKMIGLLLFFFFIFEITKLHFLGLVTCIFRDGAPHDIIPAVLKGNYGNWLIPLAPGSFLQLLDVCNFSFHW